VTTDPVRIRRDGGIFEVVLDRPKANAINAATSRLLGNAFAEFRDDPQLRVAIVTGAGAKFFCAGWDLVAAAGGEPQDADYGPGGFGGLQELPGLNKPVIAAVNGMAVGGGFELALAADLIIAADHARFALPEIKAGTLADAATIRLPRRIPYHVAMELLLLGRWMSASEAHTRGLVNEVVPAASLMSRARELATTLADGPPLVFASIKEVARESEALSFGDAMQAVRGGRFPSVARLYASEDHREGAIAFRDKRLPQWQGR
jgi:crotonobetainyl-CoA hydratase